MFSPSPETSALIERYDLGVATRDYSPERLAEAIRSLSASDVERFKNNADAAASVPSSADEDVVRDIVRQLLLKTAV